MEEWLLIITENSKTTILDKCFAYNKADADQIFCIRAWMIGEVLSTADYLIEQQQSAYEVENM